MMLGILNVQNVKKNMKPGIVSFVVLPVNSVMKSRGQLECIVVAPSLSFVMIVSGFLTDTTNLKKDMMRGGKT